MSVDSIKLTDEASVVVEVGDKSFTVPDLWDLDEAINAIWNKAGDENDRLKAAYAEALAADPNAPPPMLHSTHVVLDQLRKHIADTFNVEITRGQADALRHFIPTAIVKKKAAWRADFKSSAS